MGDTVGWHKHFTQINNATLRIMPRHCIGLVYSMSTSFAAYRLGQNNVGFTGGDVVVETLHRNGGVRKRVPLQVTHKSLHPAMNL